MSSSAPARAERQYYIDALRVFAVLMLIVFHTGMLFNTYEFHFKNNHVSRAIDVFVNTPIYFWHMPLFMLLAGASTWYAFGKRGVGGYFMERVRRILLPLMVGIAVVIPPQVYLERTIKGQFTGSFLDFYPSFWTTGVYPQGNFSYHHLWFLAFLFVFVALTLPLFVFLKSERGQGLVKAFGWLLSKPVVLILLPAVTISATELLLRPHFPSTRNIVNDWANFVYYLQFFIYGFILVADARIVPTIGKSWKAALALALGLTALVIYMDWTRRYPDLGGRQLTESISLGVGVLCSWCWLIGFMGLGKRFLNRPSPFLHYASEIAYPYYILHQTVILLVGFYVVALDWSLEAKFAFVGLTSLFATAALCELVKVVNVTRFLFGMKPKPRLAPVEGQRLKTV